MTTSHADPSTTDPRPLALRAADQIATLTALVGPVDLSCATPCRDWDVADLLAHLVAVHHRLAHLVQGGRVEDSPRTVDPVADDAWAGAMASGRAAMAEAIADDAVLAGTMNHPAGDFPAPVVITSYVGELAVHAWDLASALGRTDLLDDELAVASLEPARQFIPEAIRDQEWVPFGPVVAVPDDASPYERLAGWYGRA